MNQGNPFAARHASQPPPQFQDRDARSEGPNILLGRSSSRSLVKLFGIEIRIHWSLIIVFSLILINLAIGVFPTWHPEWGDGLVWGVAIGTTVLFFASIVAHELSHALVARAYSLPVSSILLFLFGGIANLEEEPDSPKQEALMAGVGPLVSIGLGLAFIVLASFLHGQGAAAASPEELFSQMSPLVTLLAWLGPINVFIGLFNLLPGFPLDGGRILRSLLWAITGDLMRATRWAARSGQALGGLLIFCGVIMALGFMVPVFGAGLGSGLWLLLIGWFLLSAAVGSQNQLQTKMALRGQPVSSVMRRLPAAVGGQVSVEAWIRDHVMATGFEHYVVVDEQDRALGWVRASSVQTLPRERWSATPVSQLAEPISLDRGLSLNSDAYDAVKRLQRDQVPALPVLDDGMPVGIVGAPEVARWFRLRHRGGPVASLE